MNRPLAGCTVVVTRERRGELGRLLDRAGAQVVHVSLIEVVDVEIERQEHLQIALAAAPDWVIVTSAAGAERVATVANQPSIRLGAVGTATAARLAEVAGRPVELVPDRQIADALIESFAQRTSTPQRVLVAQADRAGDRLSAGLEDLGHCVDVHVAYRTLVRVPSVEERSQATGADAIVFASGSAAQGWADALGGTGTDVAPIVVAIGPTTEAVAHDVGLTVTHVARDHSLAGIIEELSAAWSDQRRG